MTKEFNPGEAEEEKLLDTEETGNRPLKDDELDAVSGGWPYLMPPTDDPMARA
jgi:hypothetical protein